MERKMSYESKMTPRHLLTIATENGKQKTENRFANRRR
jgi:hypothetical protein